MKKLEEFSVEDSNIRFLNNKGRAHYLWNVTRKKDLVIIFTESQKDGALYTQEAAAEYKKTHPYAYFALIDASTAALLYDSVITLEDLQNG